MPSHQHALINSLVFLSTQLFGFAHLLLPEFTAAYAGGYLDIFRTVGDLRWTRLDHGTRFNFALVALHSVKFHFPSEEPFASKKGISAKSLLHLRQILSDAVGITLADGSMYVPLMRYFIGKIDEGLGYATRIHRTETNNFTRSDQFEIVRLVERFRHYRNPVTLDRMLSFLSQFETPKKMQTVLRLLRAVRFYTFEHLQVMLENAFGSFFNANSHATIVPIGDVGGSASLMGYLAAHWQNEKMSFKANVEAALETTKSHEPIVLIDDATFSGTQLLNIVEDLLGIRQLKSHHTKYSEPVSDPKALLARPIRIGMAIGLDVAISKIPKRMRDLGFADVEIHVADIEVLRHKPFEPSMAYIWNSIGEQREAKQIFKEIGEALLRSQAKSKTWKTNRIEESALGYGDHQRTVVYEYNVPKSSITALWARGEFKGREWEPLFPADD